MGGIYLVLGVTSGGITGKPASLPDGVLGATALVDGYLVGPDVDLNGADLASADLKYVSFQAATLNNADLADADLESASIDGDLARVNLSGADLANAHMAGVSSGGIIGTPSALPSNWLLEDGYLIGPGPQVTQANLVGANLADADLQAANLDGANLTDADLGDANLANAGLVSANLTGANLGGADLAGLLSGSIIGVPAALPANWTLRNGYLFGPKAWFYGADLSGQDLSGLDLFWRRAGADSPGAG